MFLGVVFSSLHIIACYLLLCSILIKYVFLNSIWPSSENTSQCLSSSANILQSWSPFILTSVRQQLLLKFNQISHPHWIKPNTHRRRQCDETVLSRRVGGVYMNSQLAHNDCRWIRRCERSHRPWPSLQFCSQYYRSRIWRNIWRCMFVNIRICCVV